MADYQVINGLRVRQEGIGKKTGRITQIGPEFSVFTNRKNNGWIQRYWLAVYRCDCGEIVVRQTSRCGESCGCRRIDASTTHGMKGTRTYKTWSKMLARCTQTSSIGYRRYGGRGIKVCDRWMKFENFFSDMGERPEGCTIDRIDPNGDYEPTNCRWATALQQARNTTKTIFMTHNGVTKPLVEFAEELKIKATTLRSRKTRGWSDEKTLTYQVPYGNEK